MADLQILQGAVDGWRAVWAFAPAELRSAARAWHEMSEFQRAMLCIGGLGVWFLFRITRLLGERRPGTFRDL